MCNFFSFCTDEFGKKYYFNWEYRKEHLKDVPCPNDSHSLIAKEFELNEDELNKFEFNPLTKLFITDQINSDIDDRIQVEKWVNHLDFKLIVPQLIIKPIISPLLIKQISKPTEEQISLLKKWNSVWNPVGNLVWNSVWDSVPDSVGSSVWNSVRNSVWIPVGDLVWESVPDLVWDSVVNSVSELIFAYISSFFDIKYEYDFSPAIKLWESGLVPSFDGKIWRLLSGKKADIIYEQKLS